MSRTAKRMSDIPKSRRNLMRALAEGAPEMLTDADFAYRTATRAPAKKRAKPEALAQRAIVNGLKRRLPAGSLIFAITNHSRSKNQTFFLMSQGMLPGMPDIGVIVPPYHYSPLYGRLFLIEVKDPNGGSLSDNQKRVQEDLRTLGVPVLAECRDLKEALVFFRNHSVPLKEAP